MSELDKIWNKLTDGQRRALIVGRNGRLCDAHNSTVISLHDKGLVTRKQSEAGRKLSFVSTPLGIDIGEYGYKQERGEA
jgi:hypothetical protein